MTYIRESGGAKHALFSSVKHQTEHQREGLCALPSLKLAVPPERNRKTSAKARSDIGVCKQKWDSGLGGGGGVLVSAYRRTLKEAAELN